MQLLLMFELVVYNTLWKFPPYLLGATVVMLYSLSFIARKLDARHWRKTR